MTYTTISSLSTIGLALTAAGQSQVLITATGTIAPSYALASGIYGAQGEQATITNYGLVSSQQGEGIFLSGGGTITNGSATQHGATIQGGTYGIRVSKLYPGLVTNYGTIDTINSMYHASGIQLGDGGTIVNGSNTDTTASIAAYRVGIVSVFGTASIANFGSITAFGAFKASYGIYLRSGGAITNGSNTDTGAQISGYYRGIVIAAGAGTVHNYGTIRASATLLSGGKALELMAGGTIVNGSSLDTSAYIYGKMFNAVGIKGSDASTNVLINYGTIFGAGSPNTAVSIRGGTVVNGSNSDIVADITATSTGVAFGGAAPSTLSNFGAIRGGAGFGVVFSDGGALTNGSQSDVTATILGSHAVAFTGGIKASMANFGTITVGSSISGAGVTMLVGGTIANGSAQDAAATIYGGAIGISAPVGFTTITNFGTISGLTGISFYQVRAGFTLSGDGIVTNAGLIESSAGTRGVALRLGNGVDRVVVDQGGTFIGHVVSGTGYDTLELAYGASAQGTIAGIGSQFTGFRAVTVDAGTNWLLAGYNTIAVNAALSNKGTLTVAGSIGNYGTVSGELTLTAGSTLSNYGSIGGAATVVDFTGAGVMNVGAGSVITGQVVGGGGMLDLLQGTTGVLSGLGDGATGTVTSGGYTWHFSGFPALTIGTGATWTLAGANTLNTSAGMTISGALTAHGALAVDGGGTLNVVGPQASLVALYGMTLANATLNANGRVIEVGSTGNAAAGNVTVDAASVLSGYGTIASSVIDNGTVSAQGGTLALLRGISGSGTVAISAGATLFSAKSLGEAGLAFTSGGGTLVLGAHAGVSSVVSGFGGGDTIDVQNTVLQKLTYSNGVLKLFDASGIQQLRLVLAGSYSQSNFVLSSDGNGGTNITTTGIATAAVSLHSASAWMPVLAHHP